LRVAPNVHLIKLLIPIERTAATMAEAASFRASVT
jgi:hypothetical protein